MNDANPDTDTDTGIDADPKATSPIASPLANLLEDHMDLYAVVGQDMQVITVGHRLERIRRH